MERMKNMITREQMLEGIQPEESRLAYDDNDVERISDAIAIITDATVGVINTFGPLVEEMKTEVTEDSASRMKALREEAVFAWAKLQVATSGLARTMRIDADPVYERTVQSLLSDQRPDLAGF
jgi:hypothetical protein